MPELNECPEHLLGRRKNVNGSMTKKTHISNHALRRVLISKGGALRNKGHYCFDNLGNMEIMKMEILIARLIFTHNRDGMKDVPLMAVCVRGPVFGITVRLAVSGMIWNYDKKISDI